jgi:hypothetical protein
VFLAVLVAAGDAFPHDSSHPPCWSYVGARKDGRTVGPYEIMGTGRPPTDERFEVRGSVRFVMPDVSECDGWSIESGSECKGWVADVWETSSAYVEAKAHGTCELVVDDYHLVMKPFDPEHDPRVRRLQPDGTLAPSAPVPDPTP